MSCKRQTRPIERISDLRSKHSLEFYTLKKIVHLRLRLKYFNFINFFHLTLRKIIWNLCFGQTFRNKLFPIFLIIRGHEVTL